MTNENIKLEYRNFEEGKEFVRSLNLNSAKEWQEYCKAETKPKDIPDAPELVYKSKGWLSWSDWLLRKKK